MGRMRHLAGLILVVGLAACGRREGGVPSVDVAPAEQAVGGNAADKAVFAYQARTRMAAPAATSAPASTSVPAAPPEPARPPVISSLKLIRTAVVNVEVAKFKTAVEEVSRAVQQIGGYVSDRSSHDNGAGREEGTITIRVPADRFDGVMGTLRALGRVTAEQVNTQDVTKAYADLETRLKVKRETASRLREILIRQTGKVSEVLEVEREIGRVVEEIEQAEGERRYFDNLISLSTITLNLREPGSVVEPGALDPLIHAMRGALRVSSESMAALIELIAALLPWVLALYIVFRVVRARWRKPRI